MVSDKLRKFMVEPEKAPENESKIFQLEFAWVIAAIGVLCLGFVLFNLTFFGLHRHPANPIQHVEMGDKERGAKLIVTYGCAGCHVIEGIGLATGRVGPDLTDLKFQTYIGGVVANEPEKLVKWILNPKAHSPETTMPNVVASEQDARDIAAYLYSPKERSWFSYIFPWPF